MRTIYELWDGPSRNLIATYRSKSDALAAVRVFIEDDGEESIEGVVLVRHEPLLSLIPLRFPAVGCVMHRRRTRNGTMEGMIAWVGS